MQLRESFDKLNQILQQEPVRKKKMFTIKAVNRSFEVEVNDYMTPADLLLLVKSHPQLPSPQNMIALKSACGSITLDYVLSLKSTETSITLAKIKNHETFVAVYCNQRPSEQLCLKDFLFERCIGKGGTSDVYLVRHIVSGRLFALKMIKKQYVSDCRRLEQILRERKILTEILKDSKFIIPLHATFASKDYLSFLMEFSPGGELFYHLQTYRFEEDQVKLYFCEVLSALEELHQNQVLYRDLKPENILIDIRGHICLTDFGLSKLGLTEEELTYSFCGSPEYMPPEIVSRDGYSYGADFYTLGCLLYELLVGLPPHYSQDTQEIFNNIQHQEIEYPENLSPEIIDMLRSLLAKQPSQRITSYANLKRMKWLRNVDWEGIKKKCIKAPIVIDLYESNIHDEFLEVDVSELNSRNQQGLLQSTEDLFKFFDYVNPSSLHFFYPQKPRANSNHHSVPKKTRKKKQSFQLDYLDKKSLSRASSRPVVFTPSSSNVNPSISHYATITQHFGPPTAGSNSVLPSFPNPNIMPMQILRKSFQHILTKQQQLDESQKSKSREKSRQVLLSERGFDKHKFALDQLLQSPLMNSHTKLKHQSSIMQASNQAPRNPSSQRKMQKSATFKKLTPNNSLTKNPLHLNLDIIQQHYNSIYSLASPTNSKLSNKNISHPTHH